MMARLYIIILSILISFSAYGQMIKTLPTSTVVDNLTYFLGQESFIGGSWSNAYKIPATQMASYITGGGATVVFNKYGTVIYSGDSIKIDTSIHYFIPKWLGDISYFNYSDTLNGKVYSQTQVNYLF